jgi:hypothetical protein
MVDDFSSMGIIFDMRNKCLMRAGFECPLEGE